MAGPGDTPFTGVVVPPPEGELPFAPHELYQARRAVRRGEYTEEQFRAWAARNRATPRAPESIFPADVPIREKPDLAGARADNVRARAASAPLGTPTAQATVDGTRAYNEEFGVEMGEPKTLTRTEAFLRAVQPQTMGVVERIGTDAQRRTLAEGLYAEHARLSKEQADANEANDSERVQSIDDELVRVEEAIRRAAMSDDELVEDEQAKLARERREGARQVDAGLNAMFERDVPSQDSGVAEGAGRIAVGALTDVQKRGDALIRTESTVGYGARALGALGTPAIELTGLAAEKAGLASQEQRGRTRTLPSGDRSFLVDLAQNLERGEGVMDLTQAAARTHGYGPGTGVYKLATVGGFALDIAVPWEGLVTKPLGIAGRLGRTGAAVARSVPSGAMLDAARLVTAYELIPDAASRLVGHTDLVDIGEVVARHADNALRADDVPDLPPSVRDDMQSIAENRPRASSLDDLEARVRQGDVAAKAEYRQTLVDAYQRRARQWVGDDQLVKIADRTVVTRREYGRVVDRIGQVLQQHGLDVQALRSRITATSRAGDAPIALTPVEQAGLASVMQRYGIPATAAPTSISPRAWTRLIDDILVAEAAVSADARYAIQRNRPIADWVAKQLIRARTNGSVKQAERVHASLKWARGLLDPDPHTANMPQQIGDLFRQAKRDLEGVPEDIVRDLYNAIAEAKRSGQQVNPSQIAFQVGQLAQNYTKTPVAHLRLIEDLDALALAPIPNVQALVALAQRFYAAGLFTSPMTGSYAQILDAMYTATAPARMDVFDSAREIVRSWTGGVIQAHSGSVARPLSEPEAFAIYEAFVDVGTTGDPGPLMRALAQRTHRTVDDPAEAIFRMTAAARAKQRLLDVAQAALAMDAAVGPGEWKLLSPIFHRLMDSDPTLPVETAAGRMVVHAAEPLVQRAAGFMTKWGMAVPAGGLDELPGGVVVPKFLAEDLTKAAERAQIPRIGAGGFVNTVTSAGSKYLSAYKMLVTVLSPKYYVSNFLSAPLQAFLRLGARGTARSVGQWGRNFRLMSNLLMRQSTYAYNYVGLGSDAHALVDPAGRIYTADMLDEAVRRFGVDTSQLRTESAFDLLDDIQRAERSTLPWVIDLARSPRDALAGSFRQYAAGVAEAPLRGAVAPAREALAEAPRMLYNFAHAQDQFWRLGVFLNGVEEGRSLDEAAKIAREALYDYGALTDAERFIGRKAFLFYSFLRKNIDAHVSSLMTDPSRVGRIVRGMREHREALYEDDPMSQIALWNRDVGRMIVWSSEQEKMADGTRDWRYSRVMWGTSPMPTADFINWAAFLVNPTLELFGVPEYARTGGIEEAAQHLGDAVNPLIKAGVAQATSTDLGSGLPADTDRANRVPDYLVQFDAACTMGVLGEFFGWTPHAEPDPKKAPGGVYYTADNWRAWRLFLDLTATGRTLTDTAPSLGGPVLGNFLKGSPSLQPTLARREVEARAERAVKEDTATLRSRGKPR